MGKNAYIPKEGLSHWLINLPVAVSSFVEKVLQKKGVSAVFLVNKLSASLHVLVNELLYASAAPTMFKDMDDLWMEGYWF